MASRATGADVELACPPGLSYMPFQRAGIAFAVAVGRKRRGILFGDAPGLGKQQPIDSRVLTPDGWKKIGRLRVGADVIGSDGKSTKVTGVFPQGIKPSYRVRFSDGSSVEAGPEHLWTVAYKCGGRRWVELTLTTDELRLRGKRGSLDLSKTDLYLPMLSGPVRYASWPLPLDGYTLGVLIANGSMVGSSAVLSTHADDMDYVRSRVNIGSIATYGKASRGSVLGAIGAIRELGLDVLSGEKFIPRIYLLAEPEDRMALLHGLMDADGSISKTRNRLTYHTVSEQLALDVRELVEGLGGIASVRAYDRADEGKGIEYQVRIRCPKWVSPFSLPRKAARYNPGRYARPCRTVVGVEYVREVESVCIAVEAEDRLYVTEHCILTHNTIQAIGWVNNEPEINSVLVICPKSLVINWMREARKWLVRDWRVTCVPGGDFVVMSYEQAKRSVEALGREWGLLIVDEAHMIKSPKAQRTKTVRAIAKSAKFRALLTGTPIPNKPIELFPLLQVVDPKEWDPQGKGFFRFAIRYADANKDSGYWNFSGASNLDELQQRLRSTNMIRRTKEEVLTELPKKRRQIIELPANGAQKAIEAERSALARSRVRLEDLRVAAELSKASEDQSEFEAAVASLGAASKVAFSEVAKQRHATALAKVPYVIDHAIACLEDDETAKLVIWVNHHDVGDLIRAGLAQFGVTGIDGRNSTEERQAAVDRFQTSPKCRVFVGGIAAAGVGLTLTASSHEIFVELDWVPGNMIQAEDRCHRIGTTKSVLIQLMVLEGSIDARVATLLVEKMAIAEASLDATERREPMLPTVAIPATAGSVQELADIAKGLSARDVDEIHAALRRLSELCDGATSRDGDGFSRVDVNIGHSLANAKKLTPKQAALGSKLCKKYQGQLGEGCWSK